MFGATTSGIAAPCAASAAFCAASRPVVPTTAGGDVRERSRRTGEIDQDVTAGERGIDIGGHGDGGGAAEALAGVAAERGTAGYVERGGENDALVGQRGLDQRLSHAPGGASDRDADRHRAIS